MFRLLYTLYEMVSPTTVAESEKWLKSLQDDCMVKHEDDLTAEVIAKLKPQYCAKLVFQAKDLILKLLNDDHVSEVTTLSKELIQRQRDVIRLQKQLNDAKNEQLVTVAKTVSAKIDSVNSEVQSYSEAVKSQVDANPAVSFSSADVTAAVKTALTDRADEEGRDCNVLLFGLEETEGEKLGEKVSAVFQAVGEKPKFEAKRIGSAKPGQSRPVKAVFRSSSAAKSVLGKAPKLRDNEVYRKVFVSPDRTPGQRAEHRALVEELKRRRAEEKGKRHFIRGGCVESVDV